MNEYFKKEDIEITNKHMIRSLTSFIIKEMTIKTKIKYYFTPRRITKKLKSLEFQVLTKMRSNCNSHTK